MTDDSSQFYLFCSFNYSTSFTCSVNCPWCFNATCLCSTICSFSCFIGCLVNEFITYLKCLLGSVDMCIVHAKNFELPFLVILLLARCVPCVLLQCSWIWTKTNVFQFCSLVCTAKTYPASSANQTPKPTSTNHLHPKFQMNKLSKGFKPQRGWVLPWICSNYQTRP